MSYNQRKARQGQLAALLLIAGITGCASVQPSQVEPATPLAASVEDVARQLYDAARLRADINSMRVYLHDVSEVNGDGIGVVGDLTSLSAELSSELTMALGSRFRVVDAELLGPPTLDGGGTASDVARHFKATHLVVGTYAPHQNDVQLSVRLVDAESYVVVAVARGQVPVEGLSDKSRVALGDLPPPRIPTGGSPYFDSQRSQPASWNAPRSTPSSQSSQGSSAKRGWPYERNTTPIETTPAKLAPTRETLIVSERSGSRRLYSAEKPPQPPPASYVSGPAASRLASIGRDLP